ncbi:hypothetical protein HMPREF1544_04864 [Mucor circinelloides 1006PhL]|uniref:BZIP domain-containing protein n=1 Tax=Mucor circinelloides f. circinelloides (strain 1006PhL) TaxID=1220926 RepID=S2K7P0_MUCC1|nr:hypothetical protein HMPREF1544_04864 [Mucor circinelloides 1006PhL]
MANASNSSNILPPISMFTSRSNNSPQTFMPASPPSSGYDKQLNSLPILPKQSLPPSSSHYKHHHTDRQPELLSPPLSSSSSSSYYQKQPPTTASSTSSTSSYTPATPDQNTLWALFSQFQQQQQQQQQEQHKKTDAYRYASKEAEPNRRASDPTSLNKTPIATSDRVLTSEEVLAEKRRRNAGASARFRDRRKQRERELQDKCHELEQRSKEFENALRRIDPDHPLLLSKQPQPSSHSTTSTPPASEYHHRRSITSTSPPPHPHPPSQSSASHSYSSDQSTLFDRVGQLEHLMTRFKEEKETDVQKLDELEKENKYLRSLLVPVSLPSATALPTTRDSATDSDSSATSHTSASTSTKRKQDSYQHDQEHKRPHLFFSSSHHSDDK